MILPIMKMDKLSQMRKGQINQGQLLLWLRKNLILKIKKLKMKF